MDQSSETTQDVRATAETLEVIGTELTLLLDRFQQDPG